MKRLRKILFVAAMLPVLASSPLYACPACGSANPNFKSSLADGMNAGILTLLGILATVLACFVVFFVHVMRGDESQADNSTPPTPNPTSQNPSDV